jgi:thymidylate synthase ThyX
LRTGQDTQLEHRLIADEIKQTLIEVFPNTAEALNWKNLID